MALPLNKTKIVCTIGPASRSPEIIEQMILAGMNVARINFSHGDFADHNEVISKYTRGFRSTRVEMWLFWPTCPVPKFG